MEYKYDIFYSLILGIIIGLFLFFCFNTSVTYRGPNSNDVRKKIFSYQNKCYRFVPKVYNN